ncbi:transketolase [Thalassospira alkalitolerans]|uniref:Transketolase n=1 Tax=Thalassospira alkalitolerans TaxID=1293890 RepID=A0A1Y2LIM2_9PROT|nr:transketolase [Thalassospira alkalitolerans]OSQ50084.1 transketolase [Thalassospira alkalitolerans]
MINSLEETARKLRRRIIEYSYKTKTPHLGSCLSCIDILVVLYFDIANVNPNSPNDPDRDKVILSKGHAAPALFQVLALKGFFPYESLINSDHVNGGLFGEHPPTPSHLPGIEAATGSLGHGMPMGVGMALANRIQGRDARVFAVLGDGECNEGSIWEAAMFAGSHRLDNLTVIVDFNKWQATDRSSDVLAINPFKDKWSAFGWNTFEVDGHDIPSMIKLLQSDSNKSGQPLAIIAHTVKGKGIDFMEDDNNWHYRTPNAVEFAMALEQLGYDQ